MHVDVHVVAPRDDGPVYTLVTSGMSQKPMADGSFAELTITLPPTWPARAARTSPRPRRQLAVHVAPGARLAAARVRDGPLDRATVPNGDPPEPYAPNTRLCGALIAPRVTAPDEFKLVQHGEREIHILAVYPLHADEMQLKLDKGTDALSDLLDDASLTGDPRRRPAQHRACEAPRLVPAIVPSARRSSRRPGVLRSRAGT